MRPSLVEAISAAWQGVLANKARSMLTMAGIAIGVASVIIVVAIVQSLETSVTSSFDGLGSNSLTVRPYTAFEDQLRGVTNRLTLDDYRAIDERVYGIEDISPVLLPFGNFGTDIRYEDRPGFAQVYGVNPNYQEIYRSFVERGRFIDVNDVDQRRKVAVMGPKTLEDLDVEDDVLGEFIFVNRDWYRIVGIMEARGDILGISQDSYVLVPFTTAETAVADTTKLDLVINLSLADGEDVEAVQERVIEVLRDSHGLSPDADDDFRVDTPKQLTETFDSIIGVITIGSAGMVGISLLVGGIGIMNMMMTSVTERTREIGICKALGARRADILLQFLLEAIILAAVGALAGVLAGLAVAFSLPLMIPAFPPVEVPVWAIVIAVSFCTFIGVLFGVLPAANAANLDPVEALRHE